MLAKSGAQLVVLPWVSLWGVIPDVIMVGSWAEGAWHFLYYSSNFCVNLTLFQNRT